MNICTSCGNRDNRVAARRCDQCGAKLPAATAAQTALDSPPQRQTAAVNRTRRFALPGVQDLTKEQDLANDLPLTGRHLLIGGPGTGKSVIALLRASRLARSHKAHALLAYNRLLISYCTALSPVRIDAATWITWFKRNWQQQFDQPCPVRDKPWEIDWVSVRETLGQAEITAPERPCLVIDEGQDMPEDFYWALDDLGYKHIFVAADFNQVLYPGRNVNRPELIRALEKLPRNVQRADAPEDKLFDPSATIQLTFNHRNPGPVARLAAHLCRAIADRQSPCQDLRDDMRDAAVPLLLGYDPRDRDRNLEAACRRLVLTADRNPRWLVGVLCPTKALRDSYHEALRAGLSQVRARLDHGDPRIELFDGDQQQEPDFTQGGIVVLTSKSCKGLEFDVTVIADVHWYWESMAHHQLLYVMVSRAIERVILLRDVTQPFPLDAILPQDATLLKRVP